MAFETGHPLFIVEQVASLRNVAFMAHRKAAELAKLTGCVRRGALRLCAISRDGESQQKSYYWAIQVVHGEITLTAIPSLSSNEKGERFPVRLSRFRFSSA